VTGLIVPGQGEAAQVAADLLSLARSPYDVQTNTDDGLAFVVPAYLAELYAEAVAMVAPADETAEPVAPRRRGRPRKEG